MWKLDDFTTTNGVPAVIYAVCGDPNPAQTVCDHVQGQLFDFRGRQFAASCHGRRLLASAIEERCGGSPTILKPQVIQLSSLDANYVWRLADVVLIAGRLLLLPRTRRDLYRRFGAECRFYTFDQMSDALLAPLVEGTAPATSALVIRRGVGQAAWNYYDPLPPSSL